MLIVRREGLQRSRELGGAAGREVRHTGTLRTGPNFSECSERALHRRGSQDLHRRGSYHFETEMFVDMCERS